jgi:hypothetical protein
VLEEYHVRCAEGRIHSKEDMPGSLRCALNAGDAALFNSWGFHRGRYLVRVPTWRSILPVTCLLR